MVVGAGVWPGNVWVWLGDGLAELEGVADRDGVGVRDGVAERDGVGVREGGGEKGGIGGGDDSAAGVEVAGAGTGLPAGWTVTSGVAGRTRT